MKTTAKYTAIIIGMILLLTSCSTQLSIQKRRYFSGYCIDQIKSRKTETVKTDKLSDTSDCNCNSIVEDSTNLYYSNEIEISEGMESANVELIQSEQQLKNIECQKTSVSKKSPKLTHKSNSFFSIKTGKKASEEKNIDISPWYYFFIVSQLGSYIYFSIQIWSLASVFVNFFIVFLITLLAFKLIAEKNRYSTIEMIVYSLLITALIMCTITSFLVEGYTLFGSIARTALVFFIAGFILYRIKSFIENMPGCGG